MNTPWWLRDRIFGANDDVLGDKRAFFESCSTEKRCLLSVGLGCN